MEFRILGPLEIVDDRGANVGLRGGRERAVVALLLLSANRVVSAERLADDLWGQRLPEGAAHALHVHLSRLRTALREAGCGEVVVTRPPGYMVQVDASTVDAVRFEALVGQARELIGLGEADQAAAMLREALALWRGPALADVADLPRAQAEAVRLEEARLAALEDRVEADLACGRHTEVVAELEALTRAHPLRERLWGQRMVALYRTGRQADALRAYQELRLRLSEELGLEPSNALRRMERAILRHEPGLDWPLQTATPEPSSIRTEILAREEIPPVVPMPALLTEIGRVFVGREIELNQLEALWTQSEGHGRRLALLSGEPGVGKTRLAAEFARRLHNDGSTVLAGRCDEDLGVPYQPFVETLRHFVEHTPEVHLRPGLGRYAGELVRIQPDLADRIPELAPPLQSDADTERYRLFEAVAAWLSAVSSDQALLLVLDDLQWATKPTLLLLRHLMRSPERLRLLIVGAYRDTELRDDHPLVEVLADFRRQSGVKRMSLAGLNQADVARFMAQAAGHELDEGGLALARIIHSETDGNPFFVREIIRDLAETGSIERRDGRWGTRLLVEEVGVPEGVREVVGRRLARLSGDANHALRVAAAAGTEFELSVVGAASGLAAERLLIALEEATAARLLVEVPGPRPGYRFTHALVRDTLYRDLSTGRRGALHRAVADAIEAVRGALDDDLPALAQHWARAAAAASETARAVEYASRAGDRALAQLAHDEATAYYSSALELLDTAGAADDLRRLQLLISLGEAQRRAGDPRHRQTLLDAARLAQQRGDSRALARAALANSRGALYSATLAVDADRVAVLEAAIEALGAEDSGLRARLLANLGLERSWESDPQRRRRLSDEAVRIARGIGDDRTLAHVLLARDFTITAPDNVEERFAATSELLALADALGDPVVTSRALMLRFKASMERADVTEAERCQARNQAIVADLGQPAMTWSIMHEHAGLTLLRGDLVAAETEIFAAHEHAIATGQPDAFLWFVAQLFLLRLEQGRMAEIEEMMGGLVERTQARSLKAAYGRLLAESDRLADAGMIFDELAASRFAVPTNNVMWLRFGTDCASLCARLGRAASAPTLRSMLDPYADQLVVIAQGGACSGSVAHYLGLLATTSEDWGDAEEYFAAAAQIHERIGARPWLARTQTEWAAMLLRRRDTVDAGRAQDLLDRAVASAGELRLCSVERRALSLLPPTWH